MTTDRTTLTVSVDANLCMGSGNCMYWAPTTFDLDANGVAVVVGDPGADTARVRLARDHCPTRAITVQELA